MKILIKFFICLCLLIGNQSYSQSYISVQGNFNYWQHTELFGPGIGLGYQYKKDKWAVSMEYDYGYGTINRLNSFDNLNYDNYSTVMVLNEKGSWDEYLCCHNLEDIYELPGTSDYGKQHQLSLQIGYNLWNKNKFDIIGKIGGFGAFVEQFFTFKNFPLYYVDLTPFYRGPLNYIPVTTQKIMTLGANMELAMEYTSGHKIWGPYINIGLGPRYSSYASIGVRLSTQLQKK